MTAREDQLWFKFFRRFSIILAIKTALLTVVCYHLGFYISQLYHFNSPEISGLWCTISGIIVLQVFIDESFSAAWLRIVGSFIGAMTSFIFSHFWGYSLSTLALCVLCTVMFVSACKLKQTFRLSSLTAAIVIVIGMLSPNITPFMNASSRFIESATGALIAILITAIFFPLRKKLGLLQR